MNQERFNHYWLYTIDLHNHDAVGDLRHAVNPTSPYRMDLILQDVVKKMTDAKLQGEKDSVDIVDELSRLTLTQVAQEDEVANPCACTRKCKTKVCPCFKNRNACSPKCHPHNNSCTNK